MGLFLFHRHWEIKFCCSNFDMHAAEVNLSLMILEPFYECKQIQARWSWQRERDKNDRHSRVFDREQPMYMCCSAEKRPKCRLSSQHKNPQKFLAFSLKSFTSYIYLTCHEMFSWTAWLLIDLVKLLKVVLLFLILFWRDPSYCVYALLYFWCTRLVYTLNVLHLLGNANNILIWWIS